VTDAIVDGELFDALGGDATIELVVDKLYERLSTDATVLHFFEPERLTSLKAAQRAWFSAVLLGVEPPTDLGAVHASLDIDDAHVGAVVGHLDSVLAEVGAPDRARHAVIGVVSRLWHARRF
jgi:truncated hemoglobin YjbI